MAWVRLEDNFPEHPKVDKAGGDAGWLHVCALAYCNRNETDGLITFDRLHRLSDRRQPLKLVQRLLDVGLWEPDPEGLRIHDYLHYQPSKASREAEREKARERMRLARESKPSSPNVHPEQRPNNARSSRNPDPTRPDPIEPVSENPTSQDTPRAGDNSRRTATLEVYARLAIDAAKARGTEIRNEILYAEKAKAGVSERNADLDALLDMFPTAPASAVAAWLMGDKHSMRYYQRADELAEALDGDEDATILHLHGRPA